VDSDFAAARLTSAGALDDTYGQGGRVHVQGAGRADLPRCATLLGDGRLVVGGRTGADGGSVPDAMLAFFGADGAPDGSMGAGGVVRLDLSAGDSDEFTGLAVQPDGKLVATASARIQGVYRQLLLRFLPTGGQDQSFGTGGRVQDTVGASGDTPQAVAVQADGRIVTVGLTRASDAILVEDFLVTRHETTGGLDPSFASGGISILDFFGSSDGANAVVVQPDGKLLVGGLARNGSTNGLAMVRYLP
jgi:uncharacterized delta-60 repeat protein